jgi:hypothetical protein
VDFIDLPPAGGPDRVVIHLLLVGTHFNLLVGIDDLEPPHPPALLPPQRGAPRAQEGHRD